MNVRLKVLNIGLPFREHHDRGAVIKEGIMERVTAAKDQIIAERAPDLRGKHRT